ncbi:MAG TPA: zeta toxin family protein [Candidatus Aquabacterium excrementipullorum]|nr:zeta toxin family protein [Candidatus Aquabacterium excrementipullorum]
MATTDHTPRLFVLAGTNGAGKSSVGGATIRARGAQYFNPDEAAAAIRRAQPHLSATQANSAAWHEGKRLLQHAIAKGMDYNFETTLGGKSFAKLLEEAARQGFEVRVWYVGLASPEHHLARVKARVRKGGHDIPEADIRRRFDQSRLQLIQLLPVLTELRVYDNTAEADPHKGVPPKPQLLLHWQRGKDGRGVVKQPQDATALAATPEWAKPVVMAALKASASAADTGRAEGEAASPGKASAGSKSVVKEKDKAERPRRAALAPVKPETPSPADAPPRRNRPAK